MSRSQRFQIEVGSDPFSKLSPKSMLEREELYPSYLGRVPEKRWRDGSLEREREIGPLWGGEEWRWRRPLEATPLAEKINVSVLPCSEDLIFGQEKIKILHQAIGKQFLHQAIGKQGKEQSKPPMSRSGRPLSLTRLGIISERTNPPCHVKFPPPLIQDKAATSLSIVGKKSEKIGVENPAISTTLAVNFCHRGAWDSTNKHLQDVVG
ncbi:hypothetical protein Acr_22g0009300 [Actinidia rufa]|uniref:Uncharacterized protein n=1 Tax=Actinidia rufa TaxID=165716 RepID=A0A7J0GL95_9ERIC|nr:hypothetical protein Acr_22g0009300 [Actinidia rufa]